MLETVIPFALVSLNNEDSFDAGDGDEEDVDSEDEDEDDTTRRVAVAAMTHMDCCLWLLLVTLQHCWLVAVY